VHHIIVLFLLLPACCRKHSSSSESELPNLFLTLNAPSEMGPGTILPSTRFAGQDIFTEGRSWANCCASGPCNVVNHRLSCDNDGSVQKFIMATKKPAVLMSDIRECGDTTVFDLIRKEFVMVPHVKNVFVGWVCHGACLV